MSLPDRKRSPLGAFLNAAALGGLVIAIGAASACTVRPLYSDASSQIATGTGPIAALSSIAIKPVETRHAQEVRNHLIFLLNGGAGQPADARYTLTLTITAVHESAAVVQVAEENEPTAGTVTLASVYVLTETETGERVAAGNRQISASYDVPRQEFAALRAQRDAEDRAARELAELLRLAVAQDLSRQQ